jgi:hypothetical protein
LTVLDLDSRHYGKFQNTRHYCLPATAQFNRQTFDHAPITGSLPSRVVPDWLLEMAAYWI